MTKEKMSQNNKTADVNNSNPLQMEMICWETLGPGIQVRQVPRLPELSGHPQQDTVPNPRCSVCSVMAEGPRQRAQIKVYVASRLPFLILIQASAGCTVTSQIHCQRPSAVILNENCCTDDMHLYLSKTQRRSLFHCQ